MDINAYCWTLIDVDRWWWLLVLVYNGVGTLFYLSIDIFIVLVSVVVCILIYGDVCYSMFLGVNRSW